MRKTFWNNVMLTSVLFLIGVNMFFWVTTPWVVPLHRAVMHMALTVMGIIIIAGLIETRPDNDRIKKFLSEMF